jgi:NTE family protein
MAVAATAAARTLRKLVKPHPDIAAFSQLESRHFQAACGRAVPPTIADPPLSPYCAAPAFGRSPAVNRRSRREDLVTSSDIENKSVDAGHIGVKSGGPSIGLVLGSGAARGFAHIGVMRALLAHGIKPDIIVGTSMGALVGGCYATNQLDALETWSRSLTMRRIIGYLDVKIGGSGLISGGRLATELQASIGEADIEKLPIRFAAIATEIGTGHEVWLTRGSLSLAVRASYALPGIFAPVHLGGRWLVDGALVNPVPVSAARALGARVVIAVNMDADRFGRGTTIASHGSEADDAPPAAPAEPPRNGLARLRGIFGAERALKRQMIADDARPSFSTVMIESFNIMQDRLTRMRLAGDPPDVHITPRVGHIGWLDFHHAAEAIEVGRAATEKAIDSITESIAGLS